MNDSDCILPVELYRPIVQHLDSKIDRQTLLSLSLSSTALRSEAERALYHTVSETYQRNTLLFLKTVVAHPRLACLVRSYQQSRIDTDEAVFSALLMDALAAFVNLKRLIFSDKRARFHVSILHWCTFQLTEFRWTCETPTEGEPEELALFLDSQHSLRTLEVAWFPPAYNAASTRHLRHLVGNYRAIHAILPGRKITSLHWTRPDPAHSLYHYSSLPSNPSPSLLSALAHLRTLTFEQTRLGSEPTPPRFPAIAQYLTGVTRLHLDGSTSAELQHLNEIPALKHLKLSSYQWRHRAEIVTELFSSSPNLSIIDVDLGSPGCFWRWRRGHPESLYVRDRIASWAVKERNTCSLHTRSPKYVVGSR